jgi:hypothetical protein
LRNWKRVEVLTHFDPSDTAWDINVVKGRSIHTSVPPWNLGKFQNSSKGRDYTNYYYRNMKLFLNVDPFVFKYTI